MMKLSFTAVCVALIAAGCSVGPNYQQPEVATPQEWQHADSTMFVVDSSMTLSDTTWWDLFGDTVLSNLVRSALEENTDVRVAAARVCHCMLLGESEPPRESGTM